jgi:alditol oxidase
VPVSAGQSNWAGNVCYRAAGIHRPASRAELAALVARAPQVRALGTRHSFSDLADSPGVLVSLAALPSEVELDSAAGTVRVAAGMRYAELCQRLDRLGAALPNLASLPHLSVAGACATATHGSGVANGNLATAVTAVEFVTATGDVVEMTPDSDGERFPGAVVSLGRLGVAVSLTLKVVPAFAMRQTVYEGMPLAALADHFEDVMASGYSVSVFTRWDDALLGQVWVKLRDGGPGPPPAAAPWSQAVPADGPRHPIPGFPPHSCTAQGGVSGRWFDRLPHFRADAVPSAGAELQSEYLIARVDAAAALDALRSIRSRVHPVLQVCEVRTVAADGLWLSPAYRRDTAALHFTWIADAQAVSPVVALVEERLAPWRPRPHWGKLFHLAPAQVRAEYQRLPEFAALVRDYDPAGKFGNDFTLRYLGL